MRLHRFVVLVFIKKKKTNLPKTLDLHFKKKAHYKDPAVNCTEMSI